MSGNEFNNDLQCIAYTPRSGYDCDGSTTHYQGCKCHETRRDAKISGVRTALLTAISERDSIREERDALRIDLEKSENRYLMAVKGRQDFRQALKEARNWERLATEWMDDFYRLKNKYEPMVVVLSGEEGPDGSLTKKGTSG